jgi:cobalt-zinc-cadmium efflux system membrane fusion protein
MSLATLRRSRFLLSLAVAGLASACGKHDHGPGGHAHDEAEHGDHGAAGHAEAAELPGQSVTIWAERTELFAEYRPLIVGQESRFAAHVTEMPSFKAVTAGAVVLTLTYPDGKAIEAKVDSPSNPGIFRPVLKPDRAGACELSMAVSGPQLTDSFTIGPCVVYPDEATARKELGAEEETPGRISYLKEQQWKTEFATMAVAERDLQDGVRTTGEIRPVSGREARLTAPASGRVMLGNPPPLLGAKVTKGQVLASIAPRLSAGGDRATMAADAGAATAEVDAARAELARAERLVADQAAPAKAVDEARTRLRVAESRLAGARGRLSQYDASASGTGGGRAFQVRSPIAGTLVALNVASGQGVEEGQELFQVIDLDRVWLTARVFEPDAPKVQGARSAWFTIEGYEQPFTVDETNATLVTVGRVIDPKTRTVPVIFDLDNKDGRLRIGNFAKVVIATGAPRRGLAVPKSAIVDDGGQSVAYVMVEGESFERRALRIGIQSGEWVEVLDGVAAGEHVVTRGAYDIKLSSAAGAVPAHGHAH